jgi:hypothetical protein
MIVRSRRTSSGGHATAGLGSVAASGPGHFTHVQGGRHQHTWIAGAEIEVCTRCGLTREIKNLPSGQ